MATTEGSQAAGSDSRQYNAPQRSPERPRGGKSKRTLIESACTACQKRKSRCDGLRPACTRCKTLHTDCEYNAEEGESRWSALRRKNRTLERERDEARDLVALIHSSPEPEAQELYRRIRSETRGEDVGALVHEVREAIESESSSQQSRQQQQYRPQAAFPQAGYDPVNILPPTQLPPLRSIVDMGPSSGGLAQQQPLPQPLSQPFPPTRPAYRQGSLASAVSNTSYSSPSSSEGHENPSLSPREDPLPLNWAQMFKEHDWRIGGKCTE